MEAVRFMPARRDRRIVAREKVIYPLEFLLDGGVDFGPSLTALEQCGDALTP